MASRGPGYPVLFTYRLQMSGPGRRGRPVHPHRRRGTGGLPPRPRSDPSVPVQFFSSHPEPELALATAEGRKAEFADHGWDADEVPNPWDPQTFLRSKLDWAESGEGEHSRLLAFYRDLIRLRHNDSDMADPWLPNLGIEYDEDERWIVMRRGRIGIACNLGDDEVSVPVAGEHLVSWGQPDTHAGSTRMPAHSVAVPRSGGCG